MDDTKRAVYEIIAKIAKKDMAELDSELRLAEDLRMKSVSRIELAALLEDKLGVVIDNFEIRKPKTIGEVLKLVGTKL
jgi:acyl carrier protein